MRNFSSGHRTSRFTTAQSVSRHLDRDPAAMQVMAHASAVLKAGRIYLQLVSPALARVSRIANLRAGVVIIHTEHGAAASKLKQQTLYLVDEFLRKGLECTAIEIRVQAAGIKEKETVAIQKPLSEQALTSIADAAEKMRSGSPLKAKLEYLIKHVARR